jgi:ankyrin repeat protein
MHAEYIFVSEHLEDLECDILLKLMCRRQYYMMQFLAQKFDFMWLAMAAILCGRSDIRANEDFAFVFVILTKEFGLPVDILDDKKTTVLHFAVDQNSIRAVRALVELGADVDTISFEDRTPLNTAVLEGYRDIARLLLDNHANIDACVWPCGVIVDIPFLDVARRFVEDGTTPLQLAVRGADLIAMSSLIRYGVDVDAQNCAGETHYWML